MGDRIAVMREGGRVDQYATPAELLMRRPTEFVEDFVGADRALKRLALMRSRRHRPLGGAARLRRTGDPPRCGPKLASPDVEVPYPLLVDASAARSAGSPSATSRPRSSRPRPDSPLGPVLELDDVMRDALADLLQGEAQYRAGAIHGGRIAGVLSVEIISEFLKSPEAKSDEHSAVDRPRE
jgi:osmoprotectant transport system ATP-binding protein